MTIEDLFKEFEEVDLTQDLASVYAQLDELEDALIAAIKTDVSKDAIAMKVFTKQYGEF